MNELTQALKVLVTRYPGTMAELARQAAVDRSSLYKFCNGQRVPSLDQLERLADALELTGEQRTTLLLQYKQRSRSTDPHLRAELHRLLAAAFLVEEYTQGTSSLSNEQAQALPCPTYVEGIRAVSHALASLLASHLLSGDTRPLLLSPFSNEMLDRVLIDRFSCAQGQSVPVCQLLLFTPDSGIPRERIGDIANLTRTLPFLFLPKMSYKAHVVRSDMSATPPGILMPVYLLFPEKAIFMDAAGQKAMILSDTDVVHSLRLSFSRTFVDAASVLKLASTAHDFRESIALYSTLFTGQPHSFMVRYQPPFSLFADVDMAARVLRPAPGQEALVPAMLDYLNTWNRQKPDLYFCEEGLLQFVRSGAMYDLPPELITAPDNATRRELLLRLRRAAADDRRTVRIVNTSQLPLTPSMSVNVFAGRGVVFCQADPTPDKLCCREYLMEDPLLTETLMHYLNDLRGTEHIRSQKYTLDFIDYCLRLL